MYYYVFSETLIHSKIIRLKLKKNQQNKIPKPYCGAFVFDFEEVFLHCFIYIFA